MGMLSPLKWHTYRGARRAMREWHGLWTDRRLDRLADEGSAFAERVARALRRAGEEPDPQAGEWRRRIEAERERMLASEVPLVNPPDMLPDKPGLTLAEACNASIAPPAGLVLHNLLREFRPAVALELGTNVGISSAYQASALAALGRGTLVTLEGSSARLEQAVALHERLGLDDVRHVVGPFRKTLEPTLEKFGPVDYAFVDGHHQYTPTLKYFDRIWRRSADHCIFVFDDIRWSRGMRAAWAELRRDRRCAIAIDLHWMGICVTRRHRTGTPYQAQIELWIERGKQTT